MKERLNVLLTISLALLLFCQTNSLADTQDIEKKILAVKDILFKQASSKEDIKPALFQLLDIAIAIMPKSEYSNEFVRKIKVAKSELDEHFFNEKGRQYLSLAYRIVNSGKRYQFPEELETFKVEAEFMAKAKKVVEGLFDSAITNYKSGNNEHAVKSLLEVVIMIVTPISG